MFIQKASYTQFKYFESNKLLEVKSYFASQLSPSSSSFVLKKERFENKLFESGAMFSNKQDIVN